MAPDGTVPLVSGAIYLIHDQIISFKDNVQSRLDMIMAECSRFSSSAGFGLTTEKTVPLVCHARQQISSTSGQHVDLSCNIINRSKFKRRGMLYSVASHCRVRFESFYWS